MVELWWNSGGTPSWNLSSGPPQTTPEPIGDSPKLSAVGELRKLALEQRVLQSAQKCLFLSDSLRKKEAGRSPRLLGPKLHVRLCQLLYVLQGHQCDAPQGVLIEGSKRNILQANGSGVAQTYVHDGLRSEQSRKQLHKPRTA